MPIRFHGGKALSWYERVKKLKTKKDKRGKHLSQARAERLAGWIESHGKGVSR